MQFLFPSFFLFYFLTEICTSFSSVDTSAINLKLCHNVQKGLRSQSISYFDNLTSGKKKLQPCLAFQPDDPCEAVGRPAISYRHG